MSILKEIKPSRLLLSIAVTVLIADTAPHPNLSAGLLESSWERMGTALLTDHDVQTVSVTPAQ